MSQHYLPRTLTTFLSDLVTIREKNRVALDDIRAATKVYPHIIAQFEEDGLNEHPLFNRLYLKAFVRSYANVVGISADLALESYEAALAGRYKRQLALEYLGLETSDVEEDAYTAEDEIRAEEKVTIGKEASIKTRHTTKEVGSKPRMQYVVTSSEKKGADFLSVLTGNFFEHWNTLLRLGRERGIIQWVIMGGGIGIIALVLFQVLSLPNREIPTGISQSSTSAVQEASVSQGLSGTEEESPVDTLALREQSILTAIHERVEEGDSLNVIIKAASGKLDPFRVKVEYRS